MGFLEQKVEDLKPMVSGNVSGYLETSFRKDADTPKDDADPAYGRYEPVYTEMELLDVYQDLLSTQVQAPKSTGSTADEFEERVNDRKLLHSLISRLDEHSPPEPGDPHAVEIDWQDLAIRYRKPVSQLAAILQNSDAMTEYPDPSSSTTKTKQQILPSPLEWEALIRECVSSLQDESSVI